MTFGNYTLNDGTTCPAVSFGVAIRSPTDDVNPLMLDKIERAIRNGYRYFDTSQPHKTEIELGIAIEESGIPREEFYVTSKVHPDIAGLRDIEGIVRKGLATAKMDYFDSYLLNHPFVNPEQHGATLEEAWIQLEEVQKKGLVRSIGLSNFRPVDIQRILDVATIKPVINQIELNPYHFEHDTIEFHRKHGIMTMSYGPLIPVARHNEGPLPTVLDQISSKYSVTPAQILLRWQLQQGFLPVTSSYDDDRQRIQFDLDSFELSEEEMKEITDVGAQHPFQLFGWGVFRKAYDNPERGPYPYELFSPV
jgi:diketogulonate reductase-like aldo/keto reductase